MCIGDQPVGAGQRQRGHRVEAHVAEQLDPEILLDEAGFLCIEARGLERGDEVLGARRVPAAGFAEDQALAHVVADEAGLGRGGGEVDDAADDAIGRHRLGERAAGIQRFQAQLAAAEGEAVEEPPRHAVHGGDDGSVLADHRAYLLRDFRQVLALDRNEHAILLSKLRGIAVRLYLYGGFLFLEKNPQTPFADRCKVRAAGDD